MRTAHDKQGNRIYADSPIRYKDCYCPICGELLKHKKGKIIPPYFSHSPDTKCTYGKDPDNKSPWHIRMQDYFPKECQEKRFEDIQEDDVHIADVFLKDSNMVLEFQHSPIDSEEFWKRTLFHVREGRRVVWLFDESTESKNTKKYIYGRFGIDELNYVRNSIYSERTYEWIRNPRYYLFQHKELIQQGLVSICIYTGTEADVFHRIIAWHNGFSVVTFSLHDIVMVMDMNVEEFFMPEAIWQNEEPWKSRFDQIRMMNQMIMEAQKQQLAANANRVFYSLRRGNNRRGRF